jgi:hypothetical protein
MMDGGELEILEDWMGLKEDEGEGREAAVSAYVECNSD